MSSLARAEEQLKIQSNFRVLDDTETSKIKIPTGEYLPRDRLVDEIHYAQQHPKTLPKWYDSKKLSASHNQLKFKKTIKNILVVLISQGCEVFDNIEVIHKTWGKDVSFIVFTAPSCIVPLALKETLSKHVHHYTNRLEILTYLDHHYGSVFDWFVLTGHNVYIHIQRLRYLLQQYRSHKALCFGNLWTMDKMTKKQLGVFQTKDYTKERPGLVMSHTTVHRLAKEASLCLQHSSISNVGHIFEIGRCIVNELNVDCFHSLSKKGGQDFFEDKSQLLAATTDLLLSSHFAKFITVHPVKSHEAFNKLHYYYTVLEYNQTKATLLHLKESIHTIYNRLPVKPPESSLTWNTSNRMLFGDEHPTPYDIFPTTIYEVKPWIYFDSSSFFEEQAVHPQRSLSNDDNYKHELNDLLLETLRLANDDYPVPLVFHKLLNGYFRHNGIKGNEYIVDVEFMEINNPEAIIHRRFTLLRPLASTYVTLPSKNNINEVVHFVVPVSKVSERLDSFLDRYENLALVTKENTHLILVAYSKDDLEQSKQQTLKLTKKYPDATFTIIRGKGEFSRAKALDAGMGALNDNDIAFFCDVDMDIGEGFLHRCRRNTIKNKQVYFPEVFKEYNPDYVLASKYATASINRFTGHWGYYGYGMICIYKSDYVKIGGMNTEIKGWGGEDVEFYERTLKHKYQVLRAPDSGLSHQWHDKTCDTSNPSKYQHCMTSRAEVLGDKRNLAQYIFELKRQNISQSRHFFCI